MKKTLVYLNPDNYTDTDLTVLKHLRNDFRIVWFYIHESIKDSNKITIEQAVEYANHFGIELHVIDPKLRYRNPKNLLFYLKVVKEINRLKPDIVYHCFRDPYWSIAVKIALKCDKVVLGVHDVKSHSYKMTLSRLLENYSKGLSIKVHKLYVTFSVGQQKLFKKVYGNLSFMVGMSYKDFGHSELYAPPITSGIKLLFFGSINEYKGLDLLIFALENLHKNGIDVFSLTIAGQGDSWRKCKSMIRTDKMYNLQIRFIDNSEIPDLMCSHHFLVLPYRDATQSGPLATAIAYELPVIAPDYGCFRETLSKKTAILYLQGHLEDALNEVSKISPIKYEVMKNECKIVKDNYSEETIAQNYIKYFNQILNK